MTVACDISEKIWYIKMIISIFTNGLSKLPTMEPIAITLIVVGCVLFGTCVTICCCCYKFKDINLFPA